MVGMFFNFSMPDIVGIVDLLIRLYLLMYFCICVFIVFVCF